MKVIILAGGKGTRLAEETVSVPKPMVEIGGRPILWHIMKVYESYGFNEFAIALGYKAEVIKDYFVNFITAHNDLTIDLGKRETTIYGTHKSDWKVHLINTGLEAQTAARIRKLKDLVNGERFMLTYGDGLANVNIKDLIAFHESHGKLATLTAVRLPPRFGGLQIVEDQVTAFMEKATTEGNPVNGGFFVLEPGIFDFLGDDEDTPFERGPLEKLSKAGELMAFQHDDFFQPMDTIRDRQRLEELWATDRAPWKVWDDNHSKDVDCQSTTYKAMIDEDVTYFYV